MAGTGKKAKRKVVYRKKTQNRASMLLAITVMLVILVAVMVRGFSLRQKLREYDEKKQQLQEEIASEEKRSEQLEQYSKYTQTDEYVEEVARDKLGLVKEGETVFRRDGDADSDSVSSEDMSSEEGSSGSADQSEDGLSSEAAADGTGTVNPDSGSDVTDPAAGNGE